MKNMVIDDRLLFFGSLFISLSATQFALLSINAVLDPINQTDLLFNKLTSDKYLVRA